VDHVAFIAEDMGKCPVVREHGSLCEHEEVRRMHVYRCDHVGK